MATWSSGLERVACRCRRLQAAAQELAFQYCKRFFLLSMNCYSHLDEPGDGGAIGSHQGPTGAPPMAPDVPRRPTDGSDGFPGGGKGLTLKVTKIPSSAPSESVLRDGTLLYVGVRG